MRTTTEERVVTSTHDRTDARAARIPELDGVRGLAVCFVVLSHYADFNSAHKGFLYYLLLPTHLMWSGVDLFFVLSGLLIGGILIDNRDSHQYYSTFYARRIHRILPIYYLMVAALFLGTWLFPRSPLFAGGIPLWAFPFFAQNLMGDFTKAPLWIGVSWSLAVEEQFYLIFPFVVKHLSRKRLAGLMGMCIGGAPVLRTILVTHGADRGYVHALLPCRADALAFGVVAAIIVRSEASKRWIRSNSQYLYICLLAFCVVLPTMLKWTTYLYIGTIGYSILAAAYFLLIILLLTAPRPLVTAFFKAAWLGWMGTVSYCLYLVHQPVRAGVLLLFHLDDRPRVTDSAVVAATFAALIVSLAVAHLSWVLIERTFIKRGHVRYQYQC